MPLIFDFLRQIFFFAGYIGGAQSFKKPLSPEKETEYIEKMQKGDEKARELLIEHNLRLVAHIAKKYAGAGVDMDDLISIGTIGLIKAVNTFSYEKSRALSSYAAKCIENEILMVFRQMKRRAAEVSLSEPIGEDKEGNKLSLEDVVGAGEADIFSIVETKTDIEKLAKVFSKTLTPREAAVIRYRYGLMGEEMLPQREIAKKLGISRSYVSRIETKALKKLQLALRDEPED